MSDLTYRGSFILNDGYGRVANDIVMGLFQRGWDLYLNDINERKYTIARGHPLISKNYDTLFRYRNTEYQINHFPPVYLPPRVSSLTKTILYTTFETTQPPLSWKRRIEKTSKALVLTSDWVRSVFTEALDIQVPMHVVHHGFDLPEIDVEKKWGKDGPFRFLMVAANPFDARKNGWAALRAFELAFPRSGNDDVEIWFIGHGQPNIFSDDPRIMNIRGDLNDSAYHKILEMCHALVAPFRGEGFGMPIFESMHFGLIPIITDWSTPGQLIPSSLALKIPVKELSLVHTEMDNPYKGVFFDSNKTLGYWAEPSLPHLVELMRQCYDLRDSMVDMAIRSSAYVSTFTTKKMVDEFEVILANL